MSFLDRFIRKTEPEISHMICLSSSGEQETTDYSVKEDRSSKVTHEGIGKVKYGSGVPPAVYDTAVAAIKKYPIVFSCVTARSEAFAGLSVKVYDIKGGQEGEVKDHDFYQIYNRPNPYQGKFEFNEQISQSLDVTGNAFIALESKGKAMEMYLLPTKYVAIIPDAKKKVKEYLYYINGQSVKYKPEEIIHIKYSDVDDSYYGAPPLASANDILTFENYRIQFANTFFRNGAVPLGALLTDAVLGDTLLRKLRGEWTNIHGGIANSSKIAILQGGLKYQQLTPPIKDLELSNLKRLSNDDIKLIFKVNDAVLGSLEGTGGKEGKDALTAFWRSSMIPHIQRIESALNRGLRDVMLKGGKQVIHFDLTTVAALSDSKESTATYISTLMAASVITANEGRALLGLPPSTDPNASILLISNSFFGNQMMPANQAAGTTAQVTNDTKPTVKPVPVAAKPPAKPAEKPKT